VVTELGMRHLALLLSFVLIAFAGRALAAETTLDVGIFSGQRITACTIDSQSALRLESPGEEEARELPRGITLTLSAKVGAVRLQRSDGGAEGLDVGFLISSASPLRVCPGAGKARTYRGTLRLAATGDSLQLINQVELEDYLRGVVPAEMPAEFAPEALKAQVITARTYALVNRARHARDGFNLCDRVHCQAYLGVDWEDRRVDAAIEETKGLILTYRGALASVVYHDTCGGQTAAVETAWPGARPLPYLISVDDTYAVAPLCQASPKARWTRRITQEQLSGALATYGVTAPVTMVQPRGCEHGGRADHYRLVGKDAEWTVPAGALRQAVTRALGADALPSADFVADIASDTISFTGWGNGHGVGLCQWGANALAKQGLSASQILAHYYPGTEIEPATLQSATTPLRSPSPPTS